MAKKKRYCPNCGAKSDDYVCDICDRKTKAMSEKSYEEMLDIVEEQETSSDKRLQSDFSGDQGHKESKEYHKEKKHSILRMDKSDHPYYEAHSKAQDRTGIFILCRGIAIFLVIVIIGFTFMNVAIEKPKVTPIMEPFIEGEESDQMAVMFDKIRNMIIYEDNPRVQVKPVFEERKDGAVFTLNNPSLYYVRGYLQNGNENGDDVYTIKPRSRIEVKATNNFDKQTVFYIDATYHLMDAPTTPYIYEEKIVDDVRITSIYVEKDLSEAELEKLGKYIIAGNLLQRDFTEYGEALSIVNKEGETITSLYTMTLQYERGNVLIEQVHGKTKSFETILFEEL